MENNGKAMNKLKCLIGREKIRAQFEHYLAYMHEGREKGMMVRPHMVLVGNPGTGKTTVARLFADILNEEGLLSKGQFILVTSNDLVGRYIGETITKTQAVCDSAKGGILYIDEAHGLIDDYGREAIEVLFGFMTSVDSDDAIVILSCYPDEMKHLFNSNPGLERRINSFFYFDDYIPDELTEMFRLLLKANDFHISEDGINQAKAYFTNLYYKRGKNFGNAREVQLLFSVVKTNQARRLYETTNPTEEDLSTILPQDFPTIEHNNIPYEETESNKRNQKEIKDEIVQIVNELQFRLQKLQSKLNELCDD